MAIRRADEDASNGIGGDTAPATLILKAPPMPLDWRTVRIVIDGKAPSATVETATSELECSSDVTTISGTFPACLGNLIVHVPVLLLKSISTSYGNIFFNWL